MIQQTNGWAVIDRPGLGETRRMVQEKGVSGEPSDERRGALLLERIESDVETGLEGHTGLVERLGQLEKQVDARHADLKQFMKYGFKKVWEDFEGVDARFAEVNSRLDT